MTENIVIMPLAFVSVKQNNLLDNMSKLWNITEIYELKFLNLLVYKCYITM